MALDKYKYVEEFIDPETHQPYENPDSPKMVTTPLGHTFLGHRIAKIKWVERKEKRKKEARVEDSGVTVGQGEEEVTVLEAEMGEKGGWIESYDNLSQEGDCWVTGDATVHEYGYVSDDARVDQRGDVCGHAKVKDKAVVGGMACVTDDAYIYGEASINGDARVAVCNEAKVCGNVGGGGVVSGRARVLDGCSITGIKPVAMGNAVLMSESEVTDKAVVSGSARLSHSTVSGNATVGDYAELTYAEVGENASVSGCALISGGENDKSAISGEAEIGGCAQIMYSNIGGKSVVHGNALVISSDVSDSRIGNNAVVGGSADTFVSDAEKSPCNGCIITENSRVGGKLNGVTAFGNTYVVDGELKDVKFIGNPYVYSSIVAKDSEICKNAHIGGKTVLPYGGIEYGTSWEMYKSGQLGAGLVADDLSDSRIRITNSQIDGSVFGSSVSDCYVGGVVAGGRIFEEEGLNLMNSEIKNSSIYGIVVGSNAKDANISGIAGRNSNIDGGYLDGIAQGVTFSGRAWHNSIVAVSSSCDVYFGGILLSNVASGGGVVYMKEGEYASLYRLVCFVAKERGAPTDQFKELLRDQHKDKVPPPDPDKYKYPSPMVYPPPKEEE